MKGRLATPLNLVNVRPSGLTMYMERDKLIVQRDIPRRYLLLKEMIVIDGPTLMNFHIIIDTRTTLLTFSVLQIC